MVVPTQQQVVAHPQSQLLAQEVEQGCQPRAFTEGKQVHPVAMGVVVVVVVVVAVIAVVVALWLLLCCEHLLYFCSVNSTYHPIFFTHTQKNHTRETYHVESEVQECV